MTSDAMATSDVAGSCAVAVVSPVHETTLEESEVHSQTRGVRYLASDAIATSVAAGSCV